MLFSCVWPAGHGRGQVQRHNLGGADVGPAGPRLAKVRVANFYLNANGTPAATLDFYDTPTPSKSEKPLISGLAYGQVSSYVSPRPRRPSRCLLAMTTGACLCSSTTARPMAARSTASSPGAQSFRLAG